MEIQQNVSLKAYNSFGIEVKADFFCRIRSAEDLKELRNSSYWSLQPRLILGGGSNILLTKDFEGLVIKIEIEGIEVIDEEDNYVIIRIGAGENWHELVLHCIDHDWGGIENLSLIPGTVGAAPMQNIGAYGVEIKEVFESLEAFEIETGEIDTFSKADCQFDYRYSVFKGPLKGKYIITSVSLKLEKNPVSFNTSYGDLNGLLAAQQPIDLRKVSNAVIAIRKSKLPDPAVIGNAGSFFKNPVISKEKFELLQNQFPSIPSYPVDGDMVKVPAAWLIDQCGWKGYTYGEIGVHKKQALVLVNYGDGIGKDLQQLALQIKASVNSKFGVELEMEVNIM